MHRVRKTSWLDCDGEDCVAMSPQVDNKTPTETRDRARLEGWRMFSTETLGQELCPKCFAKIAQPATAPGGKDET